MTSTPPHRRPSGGAAVPLARQQVTDLAVVQVDLIDDVLKVALSAVRALGARAHDTSYGAEVRALGLEFLPKGYYVAHCVVQLRQSLADPGAETADVAARLVEVEALLTQITTITATRDLPGHLGMPPELVGRAQSGALAALGHCAEIRAILTSADPAAVHAAAAVEQGDDVVLVGRTAGWLTGLAVRLLPAESRHRYFEEFIAELSALAAEGAPRRAQFGHAVRLAATVWALRRSLPGSAAATSDGGRVRRPVAPAAYSVRKPLLSRQRDQYRRWRSRRTGKKLERVRVQRRLVQQEREGGVGHAPMTDDDGADDGRTPPVDR